MANNEPDLDALLRDLQDGSPSAWRVFVKTIGKKATNRAYSILQDNEAAYDAVADVYAKLFKFLPHGVQIRNLEHYVVRMVTLRAIDMWRRRTREHHNKFGQQVAFVVRNEDGTYSTREIPDDTELDVPEKAALNLALETLTEDEIDLVYMRYYDNMRVTEMATALGKTRDAVSDKLYRITKKLHRALLDDQNDR